MSYVRTRGEQLLYDAAGRPQHYLTGAGMLYDLLNMPVGSRQGQGFLNWQGQVVAWFGGAFAWDAAGVLAFAEGTVPQEGLVLPRTASLQMQPQPTAASLRPLLRPAAASPP